MREQWRREQQRARMIKWRKQKKERGASMQQERLRLEKELEHRVLEARMRSDLNPEQSLGDAFRQVTIECAALQRENLALKEAIALQSKFERVLRLEGQEFGAFSSQNSSQDAEETPRHGDEDGWRVSFPNNEPSFHFSPFSKAEFDGILCHSDIAYGERHPCTATVGKILGWTVDYVPLTRNEAGTSFVAHATFTRRLHCSLDVSEMILPRMEKKLWPVLVAPRSWGRVQTGETSVQVLQNFHQDALVIVCNIPGEVNLRYLALAQHSRERRSDGKRVDKYIMTIADSTANTRNRAGARQDVQWILEGGATTVLTEVDESTVDVAYNQWGTCLSEAHGRELYIEWVRFVEKLEQIVSPARLLKL
ncbi:hypothetical protein PHYSODRAFT_315376 [Phytophthora sojae]|uniref:Uncharacterized protein n=1 Tax=Phytophthora sojae (strain P6497) TaxID=1094619 RepID=G4ZJK9_PHYSP|nr:hypothetical protein PHYSODRAFT_315376 [Phytophthora sojae]EGZ18874.1 hypothetical protein PHYSODRAFT_315376 [Phytophthora sojae]|eukprot:XP_009527932.1 hypothetical protein PHYSODRAFT_315376 [Phytophthora sojae]